MSDQRKPQQVANHVEALELNRETLQDLAEQEVEAAKGGRAPTGQGCDTDPSCCYNWPFTRI
jgi:hypothetical protein